MMKRLWVAAAILGVLAALSCAHVAHLSRFTGELIGRLEQAGQRLTAGDWEGAQTLARETDALWEEQGFFLHTTLHHTDIDEIRASLKQILAYLEDREDRGECLAMNARLINQLELLLEAEELTLRNLL